MSVSSISSSKPVQAPPKAAPIEAAEAVRGGKNTRNNGDADDGVANAAGKASAPKPVTNGLGQLIGRNLNVTA